MSTRAQILAEIAAQFPDNTSGAITPTKLRQVVEDIANSYNNSTDEGTPAATTAAHNADPAAHTAKPSLSLRTALLANAQGTATPVSVLIAGDSFGYRPWYPKTDAPQILGLAHHLRMSVADRPGYCGAPTNIFSPAETMAGGAAISTANWDVWQSGSLWSVPEAGTVTFYKSGAIVPCDTLRIYYLIEPGGGTFSVQSSSTSITTGFADEAGYTAVSCDGALALGSIIITKTSAAYALRVTGVSGTVRILAAGFTWAGVSAVNFFDISRGGAELTDTSLAPASIMEAFISSVAPNIISHMCDDSAATITTGLPVMAAWWNNAAPLATKLLLGAGPKAAKNGGDAAVSASNTVLNSVASTSRKYVFIDGLKLLGSYEEMVALSWHGDGRHLAPQAYECIANEAALALRLADPMNGRLARLGPIATPAVLSALMIQNGETRHALDAAGRTAKFESDPHFGQDLFLRLVRGFEGRTMAGTSALWRLSVSEAGMRSFLPNGVGIGSETRPGLSSNAAAPTTGPYVAGSICINTAPTAGTPSYWQCTVAGTPGTWVAHNL